MFSVSVCSTERSEFLYIVGGGAGEKQGMNCLRLRPPQTLPVERLITQGWAWICNQSCCRVLHRVTSLWELLQLDTVSESKLDSFWIKPKQKMCSRIALNAPQPPMNIHRSREVKPPACMQNRHQVLTSNYDALQTLFCWVTLIMLLLWSPVVLQTITLHSDDSLHLGASGRLQDF